MLCSCNTKGGNNKNNIGLELVDRYSILKDFDQDQEQKKIMLLKRTSLTDVCDLPLRIRVTLILIGYM